MQPIFDSLSRIIVKAALILLAVVFAVSMLMLALGALVISLIKWLITGRKPSLVEAFSQFQRIRQAPAWSRAQPSARKSNTGEVIEAEVREVREESHLRGKTQD